MTAATCPICQRVLPQDESARKFLPFCSQRCQTVDLMRWVDGKYAISTQLDPELAELAGEDLPYMMPDEPEFT